MSVSEAEPSISLSMRQRATEQRNGDPYKGSLLRTEGSVSRQNSGEEELKIRRQMHKQESKDSGIVTEMSTRPKDYARSKTEKIHRSDSSKAKSRKSDSFKSSVKRSQSMKAPNSGRHLSQSSNKSTGNLKDMDDSNQIEALSPKQNGSVESLDDSKKSSATIKSMWKKAFKSLKSTSDTKLTKKASLIKKKQNSQEVEVEENAEPGEIDPVYSLLKCAADLPKASKPSCGIHAQCSGHHSSSSTKGESSSTSTSKTTSPASSASHSPKNRRKKLNSRMKSFSLDTPEPSKHLLAIDETTKKKSSSFTNTCFGGPLNSRLAPETVGSTSPDEKYVFSAANLRKKFASSSNRASSLELEDKLTYSQSPKESPKSQKKQNTQLYVVLYNFKGKEKDDLDLRAGWRVNVLDSSDQDWWKGKCNGKVGYFPATYLIPIQTGQRVFQVIHSMHLTEGGNGMKLHKDQIVLQIGEENMGMVRVQAANKKHALCPLKYLKEV